MKKQILILSAMVLALGLGNVFAQPSLTPTPLQCIDLNNPLQVVPGIEYTYSVEVPTMPGVKSYRWYVTQDEDFIAAGVPNHLTAESHLGASTFLASGEAHYNELTLDANSIELVWQSFSLSPTEFLFVVIYVENEVTDGCTTNNLKVYRITPLHSFTIDIANVDINTPETLPGEDFAQCVSDIASAVFNSTNNGVVYDYGSNELYFVVAAANITGSYQLSVRFDGAPLQDGTNATTAGQVATLYEGNDWAGVVAATGGGAALLNGGAAVDFIVSNTAAIGTEGLMHFIKIVIDHNSFEATEGPYPYKIEINGILVDGVTVPDPVLFGAVVDIYNTDDPPVCNGFGYDGGWKKSATQLITQRPTIISSSPVPPGFLSIVNP